MTASDIIKELELLGADSYKRILLNHGVREPVLGVKIDALKKIQKRVKKSYQLALDLFETGIYDAQYLAGLIADETKMTGKDLKRWLSTANSSVICGSTIAWVAAESADGYRLALEWIDSKTVTTAQTGWATLGSLVSIKADGELDLAELKRLLARVAKTIHQQPNLVRQAMNNFIIAIGMYVKDLTGLAMQTGENIGPVTIDVGNTACKIPYAPDSILKTQNRGSIGKKRATARC